MTTTAKTGTGTVNPTQDTSQASGDRKKSHSGFQTQCTIVVREPGQPDKKILPRRDTGSDS